MQSMYVALQYKVTGYDAWLYTDRTEMAAVSSGTSMEEPNSAATTSLGWIFKALCKIKLQSLILCHMRQERSGCSRAENSAM